MRLTLFSPGTTRRAACGLLAALVALCAMVMVTLSAPSARGLMPLPCSPTSGDWAAKGPFTVSEQSAGLDYRIYRPASLGALGCTRHPVIVWGNGTAATPGMYAGLLTHLASHGFIVVAATTSTAGSGIQMRAAIDYVTAADKDPKSPFYGKVDLDHVGMTGHSQGGQGAIVAGADPRLDTVVALEPGPLGDANKLHGPLLWLAGEYDGIVPAWTVRNRHDQTTAVPSSYGSLAGAGHFTALGDAGGFRGPITAWFRYQLLGDGQAAREYAGPDCGQCTSPAWDAFSRSASASM